MESSWISGRRAALSILCSALGLSFAQQAAAQATFFQVPSGEITKPADLYVQQQNTLTDQLDVAGQVAVGLGAGFDVAANIYNLDIGRADGKLELLVNDSDREKPFGPLLLLGAQKQFEFTDTLGVTMGLQLGPNVGGDSTRVATRGYALGTLGLGENTHCSAGAYVVNGIFVGGKPVRVAPWGGCDIELVKELLEIAADWDLGAHGSAGFSLGPQFRILRSLAVAVGVRAPNPWAPDSKWAGVLQFEVKDPLSG